MRKGHLAGVGVLVAFAGACNALTGVSDLVVEDDAGSTLDATTDALLPEATGDASPAPPDAGAPETAPPPPTCPTADHSCVPSPPAGWTGPFITFTGTRAGAPSCPDDAPTSNDENVGSPAGGIACGPCLCGGAKGLACTATLVEFDSTTCTNQVGTAPLTACQTPGGGSDVGYEATATVSGGSCTPYLINPVKDPVTWPNVLRTCAPADAFPALDCGDGGVCVPDGASPFLQHSCIRNDDASQTCPAPWSNRITTYSDVTDTRACSPMGCGCGSVTGAFCTGTMAQYTATEDCTGAFTTLQLPVKACTATAGVTSQKQLTLNPQGGSCTPNGKPTASGAVSAGGDAAVICCLP